MYLLRAYCYKNYYRDVQKIEDEPLEIRGPRHRTSKNDGKRFMELQSTGI